MNLVIAESNEHILHQLLRLIGQEPAIKVVGLAASENDTVSLVLGYAPDAVLLSPNLAAGSGVKALERIRSSGNAARVLVLSDDLSYPLRRACTFLGIDGFYDKNHEVPDCLDQLFAWAPGAVQ